MVLKFLLRYFANNEYLIHKLSESYPIRRAAQFTVFMFTRSKEILEILNSQNLKNFPKRLKQELKEEFRRAKEERNEGQKK